MNLQKEVYEAYKKHIEDHMEENKRGAAAAKYAIEHSPLNWNGIVEKTVQIPKIYDEETIGFFRETARMSYGIFTKVIREYLDHEDYRKLFPFTPEMEELILLPPQCKSLLPIARFDLFYNEETGDFKFCEINTDGTAAMIRDLELRRALISNPAHQAVIRQYDLQPFELFDTWVRTFLALYETYPRRKANPNVAIVDFLENATLRDFEEYARRFQSAGVNCEICDIRSLSYRDGVLYSPAGNRIDAIYRRAVTADVMAHYDEVTPLLDCVRDDNVFMAGSFCTQVIHSKWLFYALHHPRTKQILTDDERAFIEAHVPLTVGFSSEFISLDEVRNNKDRYMIKPADAYASKGIYAAGREHTDEEWKKITEDLWCKGYICQEFCRQYTTPNIDFSWGDGQWHPYLNMPGLYTYDGEFAGFLMRMAQGDGIIVAHDNERTAPVFMVKGRRG